MVPVGPPQARSTPRRPTQVRARVAAPQPRPPVEDTQRRNVARGQAAVPKPEALKDIQQSEKQRLEQDAELRLSIFEESGGRFRLTGRRIGSGGMATLWEAEDFVNGGLVTIKTPHDKKDFEAFRQQECPVWERVGKELADQPYLPTVYEVNTNEKRPFVAMELVENDSLVEDDSLGKEKTRTLQDELRREQSYQVRENGKLVTKTRMVPQAMPEQRALLVAMRLTEAMRALHSVGIAHNDFKPGNVVMGKDDRPVIVDFGISIMLNSKDFHAHQPEGQLLGTPAFVGREQIFQAKHLAEEERPSSDPFQQAVDRDKTALGFTLYEMFNGERHPMHIRDGAGTTAQQTVFQGSYGMNNLERQKLDPEKFDMAVFADDVARSLSGKIPSQRASLEDVAYRLWELQSVYDPHPGKHRSIGTITDEEREAGWAARQKFLKASVPRRAYNLPEGPIKTPEQRKEYVERHAARDLNEPTSQQFVGRARVRQPELTPEEKQDYLIQSSDTVAHENHRAEPEAEEGRYRHAEDNAFRAFQAAAADESTPVPTTDPRRKKAPQLGL